jgi:hypothetical protein
LIKEAEMSLVSFGFITIFCVLLSFNLASSQFASGVGQTYSQSTTYQQSPYGQQTVVVQETVKKPGVSQTTVTKTVSGPVGTNYATTNYAQQNGGYASQYGRKKRGIVKKTLN